MPPERQPLHRRHAARSTRGSRASAVADLRLCSEWNSGSRRMPSAGVGCMRLSATRIPSAHEPLLPYEDYGFDEKDYRAWSDHLWRGAPAPDDETEARIKEWLDDERRLS